MKMRSLNRTAVVLWSINGLLGLGIVAYAASAFVLGRADPLADVPDPPARPGARPRPYARDTASLQRMGIVKKKEAAEAAPSVDLSTYVTLVGASPQLVKLQVGNAPTVQIWLALGEELIHKLTGRTDGDLAPVRGWTLTKIGEKEAVFTRGGESQTLWLSAGSGLLALRGKPYNPADYPSSQVVEGSGRIDFAEAQWALANQEAILSSVTVAPAGGDGGLKVTTVAEGSILAVRGLRANDIIKSVNNKPISTLEDIRRAMEGADPSKGGNFSVGISRGGAMRTWSFTVVQPPPTQPPKRR
jgi:membrane-associated protease RseP (regulator of RpoE activity)